MNTQFKCENSKHSKPQFSSIWPIDRTLSGAASVGLGVTAVKGCSAYLKAPALLGGWSYTSTEVLSAGVIEYTDWTSEEE